MGNTELSRPPRNTAESRAATKQRERIALVLRPLRRLAAVASLFTRNYAPRYPFNALVVGISGLDRSRMLQGREANEASRHWQKVVAVSGLPRNLDAGNS